MNSTNPRDRFVSELTTAIQRAERLSGRRIDRAELASRMNIGRSTLYSYLNGTILPPISTLDRLLHGFGITGADSGRLATLRDRADAVGRRRSTADNVAVAGPRPPLLPPVTPHFVGRAQELERLSAAATDAAAGDSTIIVVTGTAGVGKTALVCTWARTVVGRYPDGQLLIDLQGFGAATPIDAAMALHQLLESLGIAAATIPTSVTAMTTLLRTIMADRRLLLIFDNARSADQVRPMLFEISGCFTIVTSRNRMDGLVVTEGAHRLVVGLPADRDATNILLTRLREESPSARSDPAVAELTTLCARLPLALSIVAADFPERSIAERVAELRAEQSRLDLLGVDGADGDLRTVLSWSHRSLPEPAARLFRLIGAHPGPDIDPEACAALLGDDEDARRLLRVLTHSNLLTEHRGRFAAHDLLRLYAQELSRAEPAERSAAATRLLDHYLRATTAANLGIQPCRAHELPLMEPASEFVPDRSYTESMEWFGREWRSLLALVEMAAAEGFPAYAWRLAVLCTTYLRRSGRRRERREIHRHAVAAAAACHDPVAHATTLRLLGDATARLDEHGTAIELLTLSMREFEVLDDPDGVRQAHLSLCRVYESLGAYETALAHAETALTSAVPEDGVLAYADYLNATARLNARCGNHRKAVTMATETLAYYRELGYEEGSADILLTLGAAESWLGSFEVALEHVEISLSVDRELGDHYRAALATEQLGDIHDRRGTSHRAVEYWENALAMFDDLRHPDRARVAAKLDGQDASRGRLHRGVSE